MSKPQPLPDHLVNFSNIEFEEPTWVLYMPYGTEPHLLTAGLVHSAREYPGENTHVVLNNLHHLHWRTLCWMLGGRFEESNFVIDEDELGLVLPGGAILFRTKRDHMVLIYPREEVPRISDRILDPDPLDWDALSEDDFVFHDLMFMSLSEGCVARMRCDRFFIPKEGGSQSAKPLISTDYAAEIDLRPDRPSWSMTRGLHDRQQLIGLPFRLPNDEIGILISQFGEDLHWKFALVEPNDDYHRLDFHELDEPDSP